MNHRMKDSLVTDTGRAISGNYIEVGGTNFELVKQVAASQTDYALTVSWTQTALQSVGLMTDKDALLEFNTGTSPPFSINLKANIPYKWSKSAGYWAYPFPTTVTGLFLTTTAACNFYALVLQT